MANENLKNTNISVLMSVYKNDKAEWLKLAVESVINQTKKPEEVVLIIDGPIGEELRGAVQELQAKYAEIKTFQNEKNLGLGLTLQHGIQKCKNEIVARMDSDDYSVPTRFEIELEYMLKNNLDLVGSSVKEFMGDVNNVVATKTVPTTQEAIKKYSKTRNPFCHPSVMFKKSAVLAAGNYIDMKLCEDYYLWVRMLQNNCKVGNIAESLVYMRTSEDMYKRRGGRSYYNSQKQLLKYMKKTKYIGTFTYLKSCCARFFVQVMLPNSLRQKMYLKKLRAKA